MALSSWNSNNQYLHKNELNEKIRFVKSKFWKTIQNFVFFKSNGIIILVYI